MRLRWIWFVLFLSLLSRWPVVGQWQAHFADSVALSPAVWQGTLDKFRCHTSRGLQLYDDKARGVTNYAYIKTNVPLSKQMTWHGKVRLDYTPSTVSNVKLPLYCYEALDDGTSNYVVLKMEDNQCLRLAECRLILQKNGRVNTSLTSEILTYDYFNEMRQEGGVIDFVLQYNPTAERRWSLWVRHRDSDLYKFVGSAGSTTPLSSTTKSYPLFFACQYSKTRAQHSSLEFLDIYPSLVAPEDLTRERSVIPASQFYKEFYQRDPHTVEVLCAEPADLSVATIAVVPSWGKLITSAEDKSIYIRSEVTIPEGEYAVSLRGVRTTNGLKVENAIYKIAVNYDQPKPPRDQFALTFSEFMANPLKGASEYLELHNPSGQTLDASDYSVGVQRRGKVTTWYPLSSRSCPIPAGGYHAFTTSVEGITAFYEAPHDSLTQSASLPQLANNGFTIELLRHADSTVVETFRYDPALLGKLRNRRGVALERYISPTGDKSQEFWGAAIQSANFATPGQRNSIRPSGSSPSDTTHAGSLLPLYITEIMARPTVDGSEYIELYNPNDTTVNTDHLGLVIARSGHPSKVYPLPPHPTGGIPPQGYLALTPSTHPLERLYYAKPDSLLLFPEMPQLPDSECAIRLVQLANDSIVEEVYYDIKTFPKALQKVKGVAQERIIPDKQSQDLSNWTAAEAWANYGTPGRQNSVYGRSSASGESLDLPKQRTLLSLPQLARLVLQEISDGETTCTATLYAVAGYPLAQYDHASTEILCRAIVERQSLAELLPATYAMRALLLVELRHPDRKRTYPLVSIIVH